MPQQKTHAQQQRKWTLTSVALTDAYTDFILSRQAMNCTPATLEFYKHTAGAFLTWAESQGVTAPDEVTACVNDKSPAGIRDAAIIALAWSTGLRRDEISRIELHELVNKTVDGLDVAIVGKGGKVRAVYVNDGAYAALLDWLELRGNNPGARFVEVNKGGKIVGGKLSGEALRKMLDKRSRQAELSQPVTWHDFRRTFAGNLWDAKIDGVTIQKLMGHASQNQTAKYDRRPEATRRQAVKVLHVPYKRH